MLDISHYFTSTSENILPITKLLKLISKKLLLIFILLVTVVLVVLNMGIKHQNFVCFFLKHGISHYSMENKAKALQLMPSLEVS